MRKSDIFIQASLSYFHSGKDQHKRPFFTLFSLWRAIAKLDCSPSSCLKADQHVRQHAHRQLLLNTLDAIIKEFDPKRIGVSGAVFDLKKLDWLNRRNDVSIKDESFEVASH